jgi:zinc resistance-associated protein
MWKTVLAATAAVGIAGTSLVYGQQRFNDAGFDGPRHWRPSQQDISAFTDARVAALKAGLQLTPDQEKNWPTFEQSYRAMAKLRAEQRRAFSEERRERGDNQATDNVNPVDRMQRRADALTARGAALKQLADAARPLYQSLDDNQKHRFLLLARPMGPRHHEHFAFWRMRHGQDGQQGPDQQ